MTLVDIERLENLVDEYIKCWKPLRPNYLGNFNWEDNDFGCEDKQVFYNKFHLKDFNHDELSRLTILLTRELQAQVNRDHKLFWAYCAFLTNYFEKNVTLFTDNDWTHNFWYLTNLLLSKTKIPAGPTGIGYLIEASKYVNEHLISIIMNKYNIAGPLSYSILEGLLRRKNSDYVNVDGIVKKPFQIDTKQFITSGRFNRLNRINDSLRCFEKYTIKDRGRACPYLQQLKIEISKLIPDSKDIYDLIDIWRNKLIHGSTYWLQRVPIIMNLLCLLVIDEIEPSVFNSKQGDMAIHIKWNSQLPRLGFRAMWNLYPPDIE